MFNLRTILFYELSPPIYSVGVDPSVYAIRLIWSVYPLSFCLTACLWTPLVFPLWPGVQSWLHCTAFCAPAVSYWRMRSVFYFWFITDPSYLMRYQCDLDGLCYVQISQDYVCYNSSLYAAERLFDVFHRQAFHCVLPHVMVAEKFIWMFSTPRHCLECFSARIACTLFGVSYEYVPEINFLRTEERFSCTDFLFVHPATYPKHCLALQDVLRGSLW